MNTQMTVRRGSSSSCSGLFCLVTALSFALTAPAQNAADVTGPSNPAQFTTGTVAANASPAVTGAIAAAGVQLTPELISYVILKGGPESLQQALANNLNHAQQIVNDPATVAAMVAALLAMDAETTPGYPAATTQTAALLAALFEAFPGDAKLASMLTDAVSTVLARPDVISADPGMAAEGARALSAIAARPDVIAANPTVAIQVVKVTTAIAANPLVIAIASNVIAEIKANVVAITAAPAVQRVNNPPAGITTSPNSLDPSTISRSS